MPQKVSWYQKIQNRREKAWIWTLKMVNFSYSNHLIYDLAPKEEEREFGAPISICQLVKKFYSSNFEVF
jgi:predicted RecB family nuclease